MSGKTILKNGKSITYGLSILVLVGVLGLVAYFTKGLDSSNFQPFTVEINGENVESIETPIEINPNTPLVANINYTFGAVGKEMSGYSIEILPATDFNFSVDGVQHAFSQETELDKGFIVESDGSVFTITPKGDLTDILDAVYPNCEITMNKSEVPLDTDIFKVVVHSKEDTSKVTIGFRISNLFVKGITLDKEVIYY